MTAYDGGVIEPEWRNWQTRQVEGLVTFTGRAGSSPVSGTCSIRAWGDVPPSPFCTFGSWPCHIFATPTDLRRELAKRLMLGSTNAGKPIPSASLILSSVPTLGFTEPCSTLTTIRRLTPAASAS